MGYVDVPLDSLAALDLGDRGLLDDESLELLESAGQKHHRHGLAARVLGIDHLATRVLAPMPTEDFVRNYGRRRHHIAYEVVDGEIQGEKNLDFVVDVLRDLASPSSPMWWVNARISPTSSRSSPRPLPIRC